MTLSAIAVPSVAMRVASHGGTRPPCNGRSAMPERFTRSLSHVNEASDRGRVGAGVVTSLGLLVRLSGGRVFRYVVRPLARRRTLVPLLRAVVALEHLQRSAYACHFDEPNRRRQTKGTDADGLHVFAPSKILDHDFAHSN